MRKKKACSVSQIAKSGTMPCSSEGPRKVWIAPKLFLQTVPKPSVWSSFTYPTPHPPCSKPGLATFLISISEIPGSIRSPGGVNGHPLQYSCLECHMDRGAWQTTVHGVTKSRTRPKQLSMHAHTKIVSELRVLPQTTLPCWFLQNSSNSWPQFLSSHWDFRRWWPPGGECPVRRLPSESLGFLTKASCCSMKLWACVLMEIFRLVSQCRSTGDLWGSGTF